MHTYMCIYIICTISVCIYIFFSCICLCLFKKYSQSRDRRLLGRRPRGPGRTSETTGSLPWLAAPARSPGNTHSLTLSVCLCPSVRACTSENEEPYCELQAARGLREPMAVSSSLGCFEDDLRLRLKEKNMCQNFLVVVAACMQSNL